MGSKINTQQFTDIDTQSVGAEQIGGDQIVADGDLELFGGDKIDSQGGDLNLTYTDGGSVQSALAFATDALSISSRSFDTLAQLSGKTVAAGNEQTASVSASSNTMLLVGAGILALFLFRGNI